MGASTGTGRAGVGAVHQVCAGCAPVWAKVWAEVPVELGVGLVVALLVLVGSGVALWLRRVEDNRPLRATQDLLIERPPAEAALPVVEALAGLRGARLEELTPYRSELVVRRAPSWTILPAVWLFPLGLVCLLLREEVRLEVRMYATRGGTLVRLGGQTEAALLRRATAAVGTVPGARSAERLVEA